jgi:hypothetical protein
MFVYLIWMFASAFQMLSRANGNSYFGGEWLKPFMFVYLSASPEYDENVDKDPNR